MGTATPTTTVAEPDVTIVKRGNVIIKRSTEHHEGRVWFRWDCESCGCGMRYLNMDAMKLMSEYHVQMKHKAAKPKDK